ncbi:MAG TPA: hypothetical protein VKJ47_19500 [Candidatus Binatia bacterium]|nr:hypothetical protein [Candidatus Binatia bacterium]
MRSSTKHLQNGTNWEMLFNARMQPDVLDSLKMTTDAVKDIRQAVERLEQFPDIGPFAAFPWAAVITPYAQFSEARRRETPP